MNVLSVIWSPAEVFPVCSIMSTRGEVHRDVLSVLSRIEGRYLRLVFSASSFDVHVRIEPEVASMTTDYVTEAPYLVPITLLSR